MAEHDEFILIDGHKVAAELADQFYSGKTGERVTDAEWDESRRRIREAEAADAAREVVSNG